ncbi:hypothetical protein Tco_1451246 [Tanacetum coccineum]
MDDPNITLEEFIRLEEEKARRHGRTFNWQTATFEKVKNYEDEDDCFIDFETEFPAIVFDNTALRSEPMIEEYTEGIRHSYEQRLETIWSRPVNRVHMLDFEGLTPEMRQDLAVRLRMVYFGEGEQVFMSQAWRRLFRIRAPLVCEFILEFLSTCRMSDTEMGLDQEMEEAGFGAYWDGSDRLILDKEDLKDYWIEISSGRDSLAPAPSYVLIRDPVRRLCHRMIAYSMSGRGQTPEKMTGVDLFYLRSMDHGTTNVPHLLTQYLFRHAEGRNSEARLSGGYFIGRLAMHFGLVKDEGLRGL